MDTLINTFSYYLGLFEYNYNNFNYELINVVGIKLYSDLLFVLPTALTANASRSIAKF